MGRLIRIPGDVELPLIGCVAFGLIDRGTNLIQVRPISGCNLNCIYCSVDEGPESRSRISSFLVDLDYLIEWFKGLAAFKGSKGIEAHIDGAGEPMLYPWIRELIGALSDVDGVETVSMQSNGTLIRRGWIDELAELGLSRINLSVNALDEDLAKKLSGTPNYDLGKVMNVAEEIAESPVELLLAPVWIPGVNDDEIPKLIEFALKLRSKRKNKGKGRWPLMGIQKYEVHPYGRRVPKVRSPSWGLFYGRLRVWEAKYGLKLRLEPSDFEIVKMQSLPLRFSLGEKIQARLLSLGWMKGQALGAERGRTITVVGVPEGFIEGATVRARIIHNKHNIYVAKGLL
ncbi:MAG: radical SAM protein [Candidatus Bathyarchaeia archaeon]